VGYAGLCVNENMPKKCSLDLWLQILNDLCAVCVKSSSYFLHVTHLLNLCCILLFSFKHSIR
jgi:hypothetical protein